MKQSLIKHLIDRVLGSLQVLGLLAADPLFNRPEIIAVGCFPVVLLEPSQVVGENRRIYRSRENSVDYMAEE